MNYSIKDLKSLINSPDFTKQQLDFNRLINLWEKIYTRRKDLWLTQKELWKLSNIPQNKISQLESGTYGDAWLELLLRLANALNIQIEYLLYDSISRKTVELYNYLLSKLKNTPDIMQFMKIPYFVDINATKIFHKQISNYQYIRYHFGPFDKKVYDYQKLFSIENEKWIKDITYIYLSDEEREMIDKTLSEIPKENWEKLKKLSYKSEPMKKLGVSIWDWKCMWEILKLI